MFHYRMASAKTNLTRRHYPHECVYGSDTKMIRADYPSSFRISVTCAVTQARTSDMAASGHDRLIVHKTRSCDESWTQVKARSRHTLSLPLESGRVRGLRKQFDNLLSNPHGIRVMAAIFESDANW